MLLWVVTKKVICQKDLDAVFSHVVQFSAVCSRCSVPVVRSLAPGTGAGSGGTTLAAGQHCCFCHYTVVQWHSDIYKLLGCHKYREVVSSIKYLLTFSFSKVFLWVFSWDHPLITSAQFWNFSEPTHFFFYKYLWYKYLGHLITYPLLLPLWFKISYWIGNIFHSHSSKVKARCTHVIIPKTMWVYLSK